MSQVTDGGAPPPPLRRMAPLRAQPGTYALLLSSSANRPVQIGRLGQCWVRPGFYVYIGSACGPGGVGARVAHHQKPAARPHWHIDYLRTATQLEEIWYVYDAVRWEHAWADIVQHLPGASIPLPRFGASDCTCASHLYFFPRRPSWHAWRRRMRQVGCVTRRYTVSNWGSRDHNTSTNMS